MTESPTPSVPNTMTALVAAAGDRRVERRTVDTPQPGPGEVLVAVDAFSVNRGELALLGTREPGWRPGQDVAGRVVAVGEEAGDIQVGARVAALVDGGGWAHYAAAPASRVATVPAGVPIEQAAALPLAGTTALNLTRRGGSLLGRRALVTGASGGVGGLAVQLLARSGAHVVAVARTVHADRLRALGATEVVESIDDSVAPVDVALESVGGPSLTDAITHIAPDGVVVLFGNSSGDPAPLNMLDLIGGHEGASLQTYFSYQHGDEAGAGLATVLQLLDRGELQVEIGLQEGWDATDAALDALAQRRVSGKVVLSVD